ncbi:MAG TPA: PilZ domain-containing protein [bacterium]
MSGDALDPRSQSRDAPRILRSNVLHYRGRGWPAWALGHMEDLSWDGTRLVCKSRFDQGDLIDVQFPAAGKWSAVAVPAEVRWVRRTPGTMLMMEYGLRFVLEHPDVRRAVMMAVRGMLDEGDTPRVSQERRKDSRALGVFQIEFRRQEDPEGPWRLVNAMNLSAKGMRIRCADELQADWRLDLKIPIGATGETAAVRGRVIWTRNPAAGVHEYGIEFTHLSGPQQASVEALVNALLQRDHV